MRVNSFDGSDIFQHNKTGNCTATFEEMYGQIDKRLSKTYSHFPSFIKLAQNDDSQLSL